MYRRILAVCLVVSCLPGPALGQGARRSGPPAAGRVPFEFAGQPVTHTYASQLAGGPLLDFRRVASPSGSGFVGGQVLLTYAKNGKVIEARVSDTPSSEGGRGSLSGFEVLQWTEATIRGTAAADGTHLVHTDFDFWARQALLEGRARSLGSGSLEALGRARVEYEYRSPSSQGMTVFAYAPGSQTPLSQQDVGIPIASTSSSSPSGSQCSGVGDTVESYHATGVTVTNGAVLSLNALAGAYFLGTGNAPGRGATAFVTLLGGAATYLTVTYMSPMVGDLAESLCGAVAGAPPGSHAVPSIADVLPETGGQWSEKLVCNTWETIALPTGQESVAFIAEDGHRDTEITPTSQDMVVCTDYVIWVVPAAGVTP